jgi:hypothetical protein
VAVHWQPPLTVPLTQSGETTILPTIVGPNQVYRIHKIQIVNKGRPRELELKEGVLTRWRGQIPRDAEITVDYGFTGWIFGNNTPLIINSLGTPFMDVNVMSYGIFFTQL